MKNKLREDIKDFFFGLVVYIRPNVNVDEYTSVGSLELDDIDFTMLAIECEEKYKIIVDEKILLNSFFLKDIIDYLITLIDSKENTYCQVIKHS
jgi:hypothetical protein